MNSKDISKVSTLIRRDFGLDNQEFVPQNSMSDLKEKLIQIIRYFLDKEFERLLQVMYRIDINEDKLKIALASNPPDQVAQNIVELIIERECLKVKTRKQYKN